MTPPLPTRYGIATNPCDMVGRLCRHCPSGTQLSVGIHPVPGQEQRRVFFQWHPLVNYVPIMAQFDCGIDDIYRIANAMWDVGAVIKETGPDEWVVMKDESIRRMLEIA